MLYLLESDLQLSLPHLESTGFLVQLERFLKMDLALQQTLASIVSLTVTLLATSQVAPRTSSLSQSQVWSPRPRLPLSPVQLRIGQYSQVKKTSATVQRLQRGP